MASIREWTTSDLEDEVASLLIVMRAGHLTADQTDRWHVVTYEICRRANYLPVRRCDCDECQEAAWADVAEILGRPSN